MKTGTDAGVSGSLTHVFEGVVVDLCESLQHRRISEVIVGH